MSAHIADQLLAAVIVGAISCAGTILVYNLASDDMLPLPTWPAFNEVAPNIFFIRAATLYNLWIGKGVSIPFAIAMVTQAEFESAFHAEAIGDNGEAFGLYQHHWEPRGALILEKTGVDLRSERDFGRIVRAVWAELNSTMVHARDAIAAAKTAADASRAACVLFEGAGAPNAADRRAAGAERWATFFGAHPNFVAAHKAA